MNVLALGGNGSRGVPYRHNYGICGKGKWIAGFVYQLYTARLDLRKGCFQKHRNLICLKEIPEITCIGKADAFRGNQVILHFDDSWVLSFQIQVIGNFTSCQTTPDNSHIFADLATAKQVINGLDGSLGACNIDFTSSCTGCYNDLVRRK